MQKIFVMLRKLRMLFGRDRFRDELAEEMAFHHAEAEKDCVADGLDAERARLAARRRFGNATRLQEQSHEMVSFRFETVVQDLRFALRQLRKNPGFAFIAVLILALGLGANLAIFAFVDAALLKPLPYRDPSRLVGLFESIEAGPKYCISYLDYLDWKRFNNVFQSIDMYETSSFMLRAPEGTQLAQGAHVSSGFFQTLGVTPVLGRGFAADENHGGPSHALLISYASWQKRFAGRANILGQSIALDGVPKTIIGVLPRDFHFAPAEPAEFWDTIDPSGSCARRRICHNLFGIARLKDGVSVAAALENVTVLAKQLERQYPDSNRGQGAAVYPLSEVIVGDVRPVLLMLLGGTDLLLLMACVNVTSLLLVRSESRRHEMALRGALGASSIRLMRQFVTEAAVLVGVGSLCGAALAFAAARLLPRFMPADMLAGMPYLSGLRLNAHILSYGVALALVAGVLFACVPLLRVPMRAIRSGLAEGGRGTAGTAWRRLGFGLVIVELATAMMLLTGAGLLTRSLYRLLHVETGLRPDHIATISLYAPQASYATDAKLIELERQVMQRMTELPGARAVGIVSELPLSGNGPFSDFTIQGQPILHGEHEEATRREITPEYFATVGARLLRGRGFTSDDDGLKTRVTIVNQAMAKKFFHGQDPIGKQIVYTGATPAPVEVVGVVDDIKEGPLSDIARPVHYVPFEQNPPGGFSVVIRTTQDEQSLLPAMMRAMHQIDPGIAIYSQSTMEAAIRESPTTYLHRSSAWMAGCFAGMALLLGVIGLYGVIAYSVTQRTREIGVRMALGAQRGSVYRMVLGEAWRLIAMGIVIGLLGSFATSALMRQLLFGVQPWDAMTLIAVAMLLGVCAMLASYLPAYRAASVNPVEALRAE